VLIGGLMVQLHALQHGITDVRPTGRHRRAVLIKARSLMVHADPAAQREDLLALLALIDDPRRMASELRTSERTWLRVVEQRLDPSALSLLDKDRTRRAELAYRLLVRDP
jgi:hypothetical protein